MKRTDVDVRGAGPGGRPRRAQARRGRGPSSRVTCIAWSLLQLWYASPLPFTFNVFILNETEMRSLHLGFGLFLAFLAYPFAKRSPRDRIPAQDWILAVVAAFCGAYLFLFYRELSTRPGQPTPIDFVTAVAGMVLLIEATRRVVGPPLAIIAALMLVYAFAGPYMPDVIAHKGVSLSQGGIALLAVDRRRVRRRPRGIGELHLPVRAVRLAAREGRRRQLLHQGRVRAARPHARRPGQGRGRLVGDDGDDLRLVGRQRRDLRHVHDPADEARRLHGGEGRRDRSRGRASTARSCRR